MIEGRPSRTAWAAARHRAVHQVQEGGSIFADPLAVAILGIEPGALHEPDPGRRGMRLFIAARHRLADEVVAQASEDGVRQVVLLGAGLDTTAYRPASADRRLRVFEVDHPSTGRWKQQQLAEVGMSPTVPVSYVGVDFERDDVLTTLASHAFDPDAGAVFLWLGVLPYLGTDAVERTVRMIGSVRDSQLVFDYGEPPDQRLPEDREQWAAAARRVASIGEPWITSLSPGKARALLLRNGFDLVEDLTAADWVPRFLGVRPDPRRRAGGHLVHARTSR